MDDRDEEQLMPSDDETPRRRWPILVAAAAVVAVAATSLVLTNRGGDGDQDPTPSAPTSDQVPTPSSSSADSPDDVARQLRAFARGAGDLPPLADNVDLYLGNAFTGFVTQGSAQDRAAWETCTEVGGYAARSCPLSPLDVLERHGQVEYVEEPRGPCLPTYGPLPPDLRRADRVTIVPVEDSIQGCGQNFAVQTFTNDDGELIAVSLLLGDP